MSCSDEDATFVAWVVLFGGFFDSYELKLTRWEVDSEEECRFTGGCCTLYFRIENHKTADSKIAGARFLKTYTDEKTERAYTNLVGKRVHTVNGVLCEKECK